jgi:diguanylate cyclase (GGDEF)-like protein
MHYDPPGQMGVWIILSLLLGASVILYVVARANYLLFHALVEGFAIVVAALIYVLATRTYQYSRNTTFLFLGITYFHVAVLDFSHLLTYKGMGVFPAFGADIPTQLWIAGRFIEAVSLFVVLLLPREQFNRRLTNIVYTFTTVCLLLSIMVFRVFPTCFVEGQGLTSFKVLSEYVIICLLLGSAYMLYLRKDRVEQDTFRAVGVAMVITAISELAFTLYTDVYGIANMLGHILKVISYYVIYSGVVAQGIEAPYSLMSAELKDRALKDPLTSHYNRQGMMEVMEKEMPDIMQERNGLGILMIDLDNFKAINDSYGHLFGDEVLKMFAACLDDNIREKDVACRFGGDEFVVLLREVDLNELTYVRDRIQIATEAWIADNERLQGLGVSIGTAFLQPGQPLDIDSLLKMADKSMYAVKQSKKEPC